MRYSYDLTPLTPGHIYNYTRDGWSYEALRRPRFVSEYGRQSWPYFTTYARVSEQSDWSVDSNLSRTRNHHEKGR